MTHTVLMLWFYSGPLWGKFKLITTGSSRSSSCWPAGLSNGTSKVCPGMMQNTTSDLSATEQWLRLCVHIAAGGVETEGGMPLSLELGAGQAV
jgi:hypothetical protein